MHQKLQQRQEQQEQRPVTSVYSASSGETMVQTPRVPHQSSTNQLPAESISKAENNLVEWAQTHMKPTQNVTKTGQGQGQGQKKKKKNKK
jgi:hypothetical protein